MAIFRGNGTTDNASQVANSVPDGVYGEITVSDSSLSWTINTGVVNTDKLGGDITTAGKALLDDATAADQRTTLGLGNSSTLNVGTTTGTVAAGDHNHSGVYEPVDATILRDADIGVSVQAYDAQLADIAGLTPTDNGVVIGNGANFVVETGTTFRTSVGLAIGTDVQAYDADTAKLDVAQNWTAAQRAEPTTDNDLSFDLTADNNFTCTPTAGGTLTFTNIASATGQSGTILLVNGANYAIAAAATTKKDASFLSTVSTTGTYRISYYSNGTNVYVSTTQALS